MDWTGYRAGNRPGDLRPADSSWPGKSCAVRPGHHCVYGGAVDVPGDEQRHCLHPDDGPHASGPNPGATCFERVLQPGILDSALCALLWLRHAAHRIGPEALLLHSFAVSGDLSRHTPGILRHRLDARTRHSIHDGPDGDCCANCLCPRPIARAGTPQSRVRIDRDNRRGDGGHTWLCLSLWVTVWPGGGLGLSEQASCAELAELCQGHVGSDDCSLPAVDCCKPTGAQT